MTDFSPPTAASFSYADNATGVTTSINYDSARGLSVARTDGGAGAADILAFQGKAVPSGAWSAKMRFDCSCAVNTEYTRMGLAIHDSVSHKSLMVGINFQGGSIDLVVIYFASLTAFTSAPYSTQIIGDNPAWFRIDWDGTTNYTFYVSYDDNITWVQVAQLAAASYLTATHLGALLETYNAVTIKPTMNITYYSD